MIWQFFFFSLIFVYFCFDLLFTRFFRSISSHFKRLLFCLVSFRYHSLCSISVGWSRSGTRRMARKQRRVEFQVSTVRKIIEKLRNLFSPFFARLWPFKNVDVDSPTLLSEENAERRLYDTSFLLTCNQFYFFLQTKVIAEFHLPSTARRRQQRQCGEIVEIQSKVGISSCRHFNPVIVVDCVFITVLMLDVD